VRAAASMSHRDDDYGDAVKQRSGWLIPIAVFVVTAAMSALFLLYYLAPPPDSFIEEHPSPTSRSTPIAVSVNGTSFAIPANYLIYSSARSGGKRKDLSLWAMLPSFQGFSDWESSTFASNAADSPIVYMLIREDPYNIGEKERLERIYLNYVVDPIGKPGPFGLTEYTFRDDSGYRREDLFVGQSDKGLVVLRCVRLSQEVPSPSCLRDERLAKGVALSYRFKRTHLADWRDIAAGVDTLIASFRKAAK
jgi:hypothetical protein